MQAIKHVIGTKSLIANTIIKASKGAVLGVAFSIIKYCKAYLKFNIRSAKEINRRAFNIDLR